MAASRYEGPATALAWYEAVVAGSDQTERRGATMPYTSHNGHMFSFLAVGGVMALRLPPDRRELFLARYRTHVVEQHGRVMKEYVEVPAALLSNTSELQGWFDASREWIGTLKPKITTRPASKPGAGDERTG